MVNGSDFQQEGGSEGQQNGSDAAPRTYTEIFLLHLPFYLSIGMPADEFWNGDVELVKSYRKAYELKRKQMNERLWLQGMYFYEAICDASPLIRAAFGKGEVKAVPYSKEPYPLTGKEIRERREREAKQRQQEIQRRIREDMEARKAEFKAREVNEDAE